MMPELKILVGDWVERLRELPDESVQCCVTSPPYFGLRDYGIAGQLGLEKTVEEYVSKLVAGFQELRRVIKDDGTLWLNLGDSYASGNKSEASNSHPSRKQKGMPPSPVYQTRARAHNLKPKDLIGIPWRVAFALQADGWYLRSDIIWHKPNPMPESVTDRPTKSHDYIFLLTKSANYFYDAESIKESCSESTHARISQDLMNQVGSHRANGGGKTNGPMKAVIAGSTRKLAEAGSGIKNNRSFESSVVMPVTSRNKRTVWTVGTEPYSEAHFATFPPALIRPCILAGSRVGDTVLDPFLGAGTTGLVSLELGRSCIGIELNPQYAQLAEARCRVTPGLNL